MAAAVLGVFPMVGTGMEHIAARVTHRALTTRISDPMGRPAGPQTGAYPAVSYKVSGEYANTTFSNQQGHTGPAAPHFIWFAKCIECLGARALVSFVGGVKLPQNHTPAWVFGGATLTSP